MDAEKAVKVIEAILKSFGENPLSRETNFKDFYSMRTAGRVRLETIEKIVKVVDSVE